MLLTILPFTMKTTTRLLLASTAALWLGLLCPNLPSAPAAPTARIPVILSTDIGDDIDDTWALALALSCPEFDLKLVVGDYGNPQPRARLLAKFLEAAGRTDIPVGVGFAAECKADFRQAKWVEGYELDRYPGRVYHDGVQAMIDLVMASKERVTLLCIGPVPNIAEALRREPRIVEKARFVGMHGSVRVGYGKGSKPAAEWNVRANPAACRAALSAPWDITITPLDTCGFVQLRGDKYARVRDSADPMMRALMENYRVWTDWNLAHDKKGADPAKASSTLFDCVAVYLAVTQDLCVMEPLRLRVDDEGFTREDPTARSMSVATQWKDLPAFEDWLVRRLTEKPTGPAGSTAEPKPDIALARTILADTNLTAVLEKARALLQSGFNAGSGYGEVWIRDFNTFIELALTVNQPAAIRAQLLPFFKFQGADGNIVDGVIPAAKANVGYQYRKSDLEPGLLAHKNTVETDQESSLVLAVARYVRITGDAAFLDETVAGQTVRERLGRALDYVRQHRFNVRYGLVWGATTTDWGDVQPEHVWGVELDADSHPAIDIYDNALYLTALGEFVRLPGTRAAQQQEWRVFAQSLRENVRQHLWDTQRSKFRPHLYLDKGSPFPVGFDEEAIHYHGGTTVAMEAGLLSSEELVVVLAHMQANRRAVGAGSIGLTIHPAYPEGFFKNPSLRPYGYLNGGDWTWFGGRTIQQLVRHGRVAEAYREAQPMVARALRDGFVEWYDIYNRPQGSREFRGAAGTLGQAVVLLQDWARARQ